MVASRVLTQPSRSTASRHWWQEWTCVPGALLSAGDSWPSRSALTREPRWPITTRSLGRRWASGRRALVAGAALGGRAVGERARAAWRGRGGCGSGRCRAWRRGSRRSPRRTGPRRRRARRPRGTPGGSVASARSTSSSKVWSAYAVSGAGRALRSRLGALVGERVEADPLLAAGLVEEEVGGDPVEPALEGAGRVGREAAEDADEDLLGEVLGVVPVAGQAEGEPVDAVGVPVDDLLPGGHAVGAVAAGVRRASRRPRAPPAGACAPADPNSVCPRPRLSGSRLRGTCENAPRACERLHSTPTSEAGPMFPVARGAR